MELNELENQKFVIMSSRKYSTTLEGERDIFLLG